MRKEKKLQHVSETSRVTLSTRMFQFKQWITKHRLQTRQNLVSQSWTLSTVLTYVPFALGLLQFLNYRIFSVKTTESILQQTVPLFTYSKPKLKYETFNYLVKSNFPMSSSFLSQPPYLAKIKKPPSVLREDWNGISCNFYLLPSGNFLSQSESTDFFKTHFLDELPSYVETGSEMIENGVENESRPSNDTFLLNFSTKTMPFDQRRLKTIPRKTNKKRVFLESREMSRLTLIQSDQDHQSSPWVSRQTKSSNFLEKRVKKEPFQQKSALLEKFFDATFESDKNLILETLLNTLEKDRSRLMSGYTYPDTSKSVLRRLYTQTKILSAPFSVTPKPETSRLGVSSTRYRFQIENLPKIYVEAYKLLVRTPSKKRVIFEGRGIVLDSETAFDWKSHQQTSFRSWFQNYLSPYNSLLQNRENFYGVYSSPEFSANGETFKFSEFTEKSLFQEVYVSNWKRWDLNSNPSQYNLPAQKTIIPFDACLHLPLDTNKKIQTRFRELPIDVSNKTQVPSDKGFLPFIQHEYPDFPFGKEQIGGTHNSFLDHGYAPFFDLAVTANSDYQVSLNSVSERSSQYRNLKSIFSKSSRRRQSAFDNWEPLTCNSWLILSQITFAVFVFQVLQGLKETYGQELVGYLFDLAASLGYMDKSVRQQIETLTGKRIKGYRVIPKNRNRKRFSDIVGVEKYIPDLYDTLLFLRNAGRNVTLEKTLQKGIILIGPPGTGKTLLVQALAGEAQVPVILLSGSSLIQPGEPAHEKLAMVFEEARQFAPCIVFIDELDSLAEKRTGIVDHPMGHGEFGVDPVSNLKFAEESTSDYSLHPLEELVPQEEEEEELKLDKPKKKPLLEAVSPPERPIQIGLLTRLLMELDGIRGRKGVFVFGATNRIGALDEALLRPGRFEKFLHIGLPEQQKRIEILQFYGKDLGFQKNIPWQYLADLTAHFSAADLSMVMKESAIKAVLTQKETRHTLETIEHGIDRLTTSENEKWNLIKPTSTGLPSVFSVSAKISLLRLAYYQAGKIIVSYLVEQLPKTVVAHLWPRRPSLRAIEMTTKLETQLLEFTRVCEVNDRLLGCYAGKAAEVLFVNKFSSRLSSQISTLGIEDLVVGQQLAYSLVEKSRFYSKKTHSHRSISLVENINPYEYRFSLDKLDPYQEALDLMEDPEKQIEEKLEENLSYLEKRKRRRERRTRPVEQVLYTLPWLHDQVFLSVAGALPENWHRFYFPNPERNWRNVEWVPFDDFYFADSRLKNVNPAYINVSKLRPKKPSSASSVLRLFMMSEQYDLYAVLKIARDFQKSAAVSVLRLFMMSERYDLYGVLVYSRQCLERWYAPFPRYKVNFPWNEVADISRDYVVHSLILQSFNKALVLLNQNRELLDRLVVELLANEILRQPEIEVILKEFQITKSTPSEETLLAPFEQEKGVEFLELSWGVRSRKPIPKWINFAHFTKETT